MCYTQLNLTMKDNNEHPHVVDMDVAEASNEGAVLTKVDLVEGEAPGAGEAQ